MATFRLHFTQSFGNIVDVEAEKLTPAVIEQAVRDYLTAQSWDEDGALILYSAEDEDGNLVPVSDQALRAGGLERGAYCEA